MGWLCNVRKHIYVAGKINQNGNAGTIVEKLVFSTLEIYLKSLFEMCAGDMIERGFDI